MRRRFGDIKEAVERPRNRRDQSTDPPPPLSSGQVNRRIDEFLRSKRCPRPRRRCPPAARAGDGVQQSRPTTSATVVPSVILRNEDYGRIARLLADGTPVELEFTIVNRTFPEGRTAYNAVAEIAGTDKQDEVVMIGGHLDSWQSATGATDNAVGCAVMMEAARILRAIGVRPRRTIRVALWSGEEQGLLGSQAYIQQHFGTFENPKAGVRQADGLPEPRSRHRPAAGAPSSSVPTRAAAAVRQMLAPLADLGIVGAASTRSRAFGTTDHTAFNNAGLTGIDFELDPIEYDSHTHHTNLDTYERILEADARAAAIVVAFTAYPAGDARGDAAAIPAHRDPARPLGPKIPRIEGSALRQSPLADRTVRTLHRNRRNFCCDLRRHSVRKRVLRFDPNRAAVSTVRLRLVDFRYGKLERLRPQENNLVISGHFHLPIRGMEPAILRSTSFLGPCRTYVNLTEA